MSDLNPTPSNTMETSPHCSHEVIVRPMLTTAQKNFKDGRSICTCASVFD